MWVSLCSLCFPCLQFFSPPFLSPTVHFHAVMVASFRSLHHATPSSERRWPLSIGNSHHGEQFPLWRFCSGAFRRSYKYLPPRWKSGWLTDKYRSTKHINLYFPHRGSWVIGFRSEKLYIVEPSRVREACEYQETVRQKHMAFHCPCVLGTCSFFPL